MNDVNVPECASNSIIGEMKSPVKYRFIINLHNVLILLLINAGAFHQPIYIFNVLNIFNSVS